MPSLSQDVGLGKPGGGPPNCLISKLKREAAKYRGGGRQTSSLKERGGSITLDSERDR